MSLRLSRTIAIAGALLAGLSYGKSAAAWNGSGHEEVADIAWSRLTPATKLKVAAILAAGDDLVQPQGPSDEEVRHAFMHAATFPDDIKSDYDSVYESIIDKENAVFPLSPGTSEGESNRCKTWHYYDTPIRVPANSKAAPPNTSNAFVALTRAEDKLKSLSSGNTDLKMQAWYLCWIEHIVGDLHQPLHCSSCFETEATGDEGGNLYPLQSASGRRAELHALWDSGIDHAAGKQVTIAAGGQMSIRTIEAVTALWTQDKTMQPSEADAKNLDIMSWIADGAKLADKDCYAGIAPNTLPSDAYMANEDAVCRRQAMLAGYRLAAVLNGILGGKS